jgi:hypothetical protein
MKAKWDCNNILEEKCASWDCAGVIIREKDSEISAKCNKCGRRYWIIEK